MERACATHKSPPDQYLCIFVDVQSKPCSFHDRSHKHTRRHPQKYKLAQPCHLESVLVSDGLLQATPVLYLGTTVQ